MSNCNVVLGGVNREVVVSLIDDWGEEIEDFVTGRLWQYRRRVICGTSVKRLWFSISQCTY